ncbi:MAG: GC-type dockerin domain-anchored protein [Phycisphaerales bacterium]
MAQTTSIAAMRTGIVLASFGFAALALGQEQLAFNGPLSSMPGAHDTGADLIWAVPDGASAGVSGHAPLAYRLAEPITLTGQATIESVVVFGYQQGAIEGSTIDQLGLELWNGRPGDAGSSRIAGDIDANMLSSVSPTDAFVAMTGVTFTIDRRVFALTAGDLGWSVPAGDYWLVWTMGGSLDGGPYSPYLGDDTRPVTGEARQRVLGAWRPARNRTEGGVQVSLPYEVYGSYACAADCDGDGDLTIFDFLCFQNAFAQGEASADCDGDGSVTMDDFACFQASFMAGCG